MKGVKAFEFYTPNNLNLLVTLLNQINNSIVLV